MTRYGYARVSTREQNTASQHDALVAAGIAPKDIVIEKVSGKLASRPQLDRLLERLESGDQVVVTRLRRIGRSHQHLLDLSAWFEQHDVDFVVLEQGIDTSTPIGRLFFRIMAALAEFDREAIVEGTLEGLAAARARGRVGGRPPGLTQLQLDQAQMMYDSGDHTAEEVAGTFGVARGTLYRHLSAHKDGRDCVLVVYRNTRTKKIDQDTSRRYGETGAGESAQREADAKWWPIAPARRPHVKGIVYVADGIVVRVRGIDPTGQWVEDDRGYVEAPVTAPLSELEIARRFPGLPIRLGDARPHVRGKIREYLPV